MKFEYGYSHSKMLFELVSILNETTIMWELIDPFDSLPMVTQRHYNLAHNTNMELTKIANHE